MGLFICLRQPSRDKIKEHIKIEADLINRYGFQLITQEDSDRISELISDTTNDKNEKFCTYLDKEGELQGIDTSILKRHTTRGDNTVLILSTKDSIEEVDSANDIRAVLTFKYEDATEYKDLDIEALCSNQITKLGGGKILLDNLIAVCRENEIRKINLFAANNAISFYAKNGFINESEIHPNIMSLQLGGRKSLKKRKCRKSLKKRKCRKSLKK